MTVKAFLSVLAIALTFYAFWPYIRAIRCGQTRPHVFSWIIWSLTTFVVFLAQLSDGGGLGAWPIGISGLITIYVAFLAYSHQADATITQIDWWFLGLALASLPLWYLTSDALWAVVVLTGVDLLGFGPTFRKAYLKPFEEQLRFYSLMGFRNLLAIIALENYSATTMLFPGLLLLACVIFIAMVLLRRKTLSIDDACRGED